MQLFSLILCCLLHLTANENNSIGLRNCIVCISCYVVQKRINFIQCADNILLVYKQLGLQNYYQLSGLKAVKTRRWTKNKLSRKISTFF